MKDLLKIKDKILDNLEVLRFNLEKCCEIGFMDSHSYLYNEIDELEDEVQESNNIESLEDIILRAKTIENQIDGFLSQKSLDSIGLNWPIFKG